MTHMTPFMWAFVVSGCCLLLEMFYAAAELSVIACDRMKLRKDAAEGHRAAKLLEQFLGNKQRFLATTLVGSQMFIVINTVVMTYALHHRFGSRAELYLLIGLTPTVVVLGEIVPKTIGLKNADRVARIIVFPLWVSSRIFAP